MTWKFTKPKILTLKYLLPLLLITVSYNYFVNASAVFRDLCEQDSEEKIVLTGKACWFDFYKVRHRISVNRIDSFKLYVDVGIPLPIIGRIKNWFAAERPVYRLYLPLLINVNDVHSSIPVEFESSTAIRVGSPKAIRRRTELFMNTNEFLQMEGDNLYSKFRRKNGGGFVFLVPKDPQLFVEPFYFRCVNHCSLYTAYKNVGVVMTVPKAWTDYPKVVNDFAINFIESIVIDSNMDMKIENINAPH